MRADVKNKFIMQKRNGTDCAVPFVFESLFYGTIFVAGSLQAPVPALPTERTRTHWRLPEGKPSNVVLDLVTAG
jgi:hypothetical protein